MSGRWMPARTTRPNEVLCSNSQTPSSTAGNHRQQHHAVAREQEVADDDRAAKHRRDRRRQGRGAPDDADRLLGDHGKAEGHQQAQDRIGGVEPAQDVSFEQDAEHGDRDRRDHDRRAEAEISGDFDGEIGAQRVERAMRQVDDAADAEDQRQPERDQEIIASEHEAIHHLFQQEPELHSRFRKAQGVWRRARPVNAVTRRAPEPVRTPGERRSGYIEQGFCSLVERDDFERFVRSRDRGAQVRACPTCPWPCPLALTVKG